MVTLSVCHAHQGDCGSEKHTAVIKLCGKKYLEATENTIQLCTIVQTQPPPCSVAMSATETAVICFFIMSSPVQYIKLLNPTNSFPFANSVPSRDQNTSERCFIKLGGMNLRMDEGQLEGTEELHAF